MRSARTDKKAAPEGDAAVLRRALAQAGWRYTRQREAVSAAFPELVELGGWRSFGLARELEALAARLHTALRS